jgi:HSP20 family protein
MAQKNPQNTALTRREEGGLGPWNPWNQMAELHRQMDELFSRTFGYTPLSRMIPSTSEMWEPDVDIYETGDKVQVFAALPGYAPDQIHVESTSDSIRIWGERKPFQEDEKVIAHRRSWHSGFSRFSCSFSLPTEIDPNSVKATFHNGVLQLEMNKTEQAKTQPVQINVKGA